MFIRKKRFINLILFLVLLPINLINAEDLSISPRAIALGGNLVASVGPRTDEVLAHNPAGIIYNGKGLSLYYNNPFSISDYNVGSCNFNYVGGKLGLGISFLNEKVAFPEENSGELVVENYSRKSIFGVGFAGKAFNKLGWGIGFWQCEQNFNISDSGNSNIKESALSFGLLLDRDLWAAGIALNKIPLKPEYYLLKPEYKIGARFGKRERASLLVGFEKYENPLGKSTIATSVGAEGYVAPNLILRLGTNTDDLLSLGLGFNNEKWQINYAYRIHQAGDTHFFATSYCF